MRNGASRYFTLSFYIFFGGAMQKKRQTLPNTCLFQVCHTAPPALSTAEAVLALYFFTCG